MSPLIATFVYGFAIYILFALEREKGRKISPVLYIPALYLFTNGSRPLAFWLGMQSGDAAALTQEGSPLDVLVALGLMIAGIVVLMKRQAAIARLLQANAAVMPFLMYCAISCSWSDDPIIAFKRWFRFLGTFITVLVILTDSDPSRALKWALTRVGFLLIPISVLLIKYYPWIARSYDPWTGRQMVSGVATDKNMLGMVCLVTGLPAVVQLLSVWQERKRRGVRRVIAFGLIVAATIYLLSLADSMTSLMCFYMGCFVIVAMTLVKAARKSILVHLMVFGIVGAAFSVLFLHIGASGAMQQLGRDTTFSGRTEIWAGLLRFAGSPLVGTGFDSFWVGDRLLRIWSAGGLLAGINEAHNGYLEMYLNLGWIGILFLAALIVIGYRNISLALRSDREAAILRLAFFVVAIVYDFTEAGFRTGS